MIEELEKMENLNIPKDLYSDEANIYMREASIKYEIKCPPPETTTRLLDKVQLFQYINFLTYSCPKLMLGSKLSP